MIISKYVENREKYRDNKLEGLISSVEMLLSGIDQITPTLRDKLKNYYETLKCISIVGKRTINEIMQVLKVEPMFHYSDAHFITTEMWCRVFLDMLGERGIEEKLRTGATVNARVAVVLGE